MVQNTIALICDCDSTLASDTSHFLLDQNKIPNEPFWGEVCKLVENGWDPPLAWMTKMLKLIQSGKIKQDTNTKLKDLGKNIEFYPGVSDFVSKIRSKISENVNFVKADIKLECFIVSQGIENLIKGCEAFSDFEVYGAQFDEDQESGKINAIKSTVTFTEKTKFVFAIQKGITEPALRKEPYAVNDFMEEDEKKVPFKHMIYLGDSANDIPCFSMIKRWGGTTIGVTPLKTFKKGFELARGNRTTVGPYDADYNDGSQLRKAIEAAINEIGNDICK